MIFGYSGWDWLWDNWKERTLLEGLREVPKSEQATEYIKRLSHRYFANNMIEASVQFNHEDDPDFLYRFRVMFFEWSKYEKDVLKVQKTPEYFMIFLHGNEGDLKYYYYDKLTRNIVVDDHSEWDCAVARVISPLLYKDKGEYPFRIIGRGTPEWIMHLRMARKTHLVRWWEWAHYFSQWNNFRHEVLFKVKRYWQLMFDWTRYRSRYYKFHWER